jgi:hypothetical protein
VFDCVGAYDQCNICNGDDTICADDCGVPNGDNSTCEDCNGVVDGGAVVDECGVCDGDGVDADDDGVCDDVDDCVGAYDECSVCNGDNSTCTDCNGTLNGDWFIGDCGLCVPEEYSCSDIQVLQDIKDLNPSLSEVYVLDIGTPNWSNGRLGSLSLNNAGLDALPESIGTLDGLWSLSVQNNNLAHLPGALCDLPINCNISVGGNNLCDIYDLGD